MPTVEIPYSPRNAFLPFHNRTQRWAEVICHRRAGKTVAAVNELQKKALTLVLPPDQAVNPPRFAFMAPTRVRAKDIAWQYLKRFSECIPGRKVSESELFVEYPNGGRVTIYGADGDRGMGLYLDGIVFDECDEIPPTVDAVVLPALSDRKGWAVYMGILRGRHNLFKRFEKHRGDDKHFQLFLKASTSGILDDEELTILKENIGEAAFKMQMEGDVNASIAAAIYGAQMDKARAEGRITRVPIDPNCPMDFFFDIGHSKGGDDWALWPIQLAARDILCQGYHSRTGLVPSHYAKWCLDFADKNDVPMGTVYLPHDGERQDRHGKTAVDDLREAGIPRIKVVPRTPNRWDSINHLRGLFPRLLIDVSRCSDTWILGELEMPSGIDCLDYYSKKEIESTGLIEDVPVHNQYSHGADALRTMAEAHRLGMLVGTSHVARSSQGPTKVLRGYSPSSHSIKPAKVAIR